MLAYRMYDICERKESCSGGPDVEHVGTGMAGARKLLQLHSTMAGHIRHIGTGFDWWWLVPARKR